MSAHASTRERLEILGELYGAILRVTGMPRSVLDLACSLNPLSFRWMDLPRSVEYRAYDINTHTVSLINKYFHLEGVSGRAELQDILCPSSDPSRDPVSDTVRTPLGGLALLLKMYHCLEHRRRGAGLYVIENVRSRWIAVSFPARNLASRRVDIIGNYEGTIRECSAQNGWQCVRLDFDTEIVLLIDKRSPCQKNL